MLFMLLLVLLLLEESSGGLDASALVWWCCATATADGEDCAWGKLDAISLEGRFRKAGSFGASDDDAISDIIITNLPLSTKDFAKAALLLYCCRLLCTFRYFAMVITAV